MPDSKRKSLGGEQQYNKVYGGHNIGDDDDDDDYDNDDDDDNDDDQTIAFIKVPAEDAGYGALDQATVEVKIMLSKTMIRIMKKYGKKSDQQYCK